MAQVKGVPRTPTLLVLFTFVTVKSGAATTVLLAVLEDTPPAVADAVFVTEPTATSPAVTVYVAVQVKDSPGSR
jgi:hypothetical protein